MVTDFSFRMRAALAATAIALVLPATAFAQASATRAPSSFNPNTLNAGTLEVPMNKSKVVSADRPIAKALVGSEDIADILPLTDRAIYVLGKKMGTTSLTLYDAGGRVLSVMDVAVGPDIEALGTQLRELVPDEAINARISNESIVLTGTVNDAGAVDRAMQLARTFAGEKVVNLILVGSSQQVMLEVQFAEVTRNNNKDIGVRTIVDSRGGSFGAAIGTGSSFIPGGTVSSTTTTSGSSNSTSSNGLNGSTSTSNNATSLGTSSSSGSTSTSGSTTSSGSNFGLNGTTGPITGSLSDFTNPGSLAGQVFNGTGFANGSASAGSTTSSGSFANSGTVSNTGVSANGTVSTTNGTSNSLLNSIGSSTVGAVATTTTALSSILQLGALADGFGIFRQNFRIGNLSLQSVLNAMETKGMAKTLARPTLLALSGEKASFLAGGEFPVPVAQSGAGGGNGNTTITVAFKPFGISLAFTPTVLSDKTINLVVEPEVSAIDPSASYAAGNIVIPGIRTRRASTTLELRDGESFAIAGLLSKDFETSVRQVPLLGSLPIIGALFRSSSFKKGETELLIVVTPRLVAPIRPDQVRLPTDRVQDPSELNTFLLGQPFQEQKLAPSTEGAPQSKAAPADTGSKAEPAAKKDDGYAL